MALGLGLADGVHGRPAHKPRRYSQSHVLKPGPRGRDAQHATQTARVSPVAARGRVSPLREAAPVTAASPVRRAPPHSEDVDLRTVRRRFPRAGRGGAGRGGVGARRGRASSHPRSIRVIEEPGRSRSHQVIEEEEEGGRRRRIRRWKRFPIFR